MATAELRELLAGSALFGALPEDLLDRVVAKLQLATFKLGESVLRQGQAGDSFYIVGSGKVRIVDERSENPVTLAVLKRGDSFGEQALLYGKEVSATVRAAGNVVLYGLAAADFGALVDASPELRHRIDDASTRQREFNFLKTQNLLAGLTTAETAKLIDAIETVSLEPGAYLFHEGDPGDAMYLVRDGSLQIVKESHGDKLLGYKRAGDLLGEMALLHDQSRSAAAVAQEPTVALKLRRDAYLSVVGDKSNISDLLAEQASRHLLQQEAILSSDTEEDVARADVESFIRIGHIRPRGWWSRRLPLAMVEDPRLSGIACLVMIAERLGRPFAYHSLVERQLEIGRADDLHSLGRKAESVGFLSRLLRIEFGKLREIVLPGVTQTADGELLVVYRVDKRGVLLADPRRGLTRVSLEEFAQRFNGTILTVAYVPDFGAAGVSLAGVYRQFLPLMQPYWGMVARILVVMLILQGLGLLPPLFTQVLIDKVLVVGDWNMLGLMLVGLLSATLIGGVGGAIKEFLSLHLIRRLSGTLFVRFFAHILALPISALNRWDTGALLTRFEENEKFLETTSNGAISVLTNSVAILIYLPVLFMMNVKLALLATVFLIILVVAIVAVTPRVRAYERMEFQTSSDKESHVIEVISSVETIKSLGQEVEFTQKGQGFFNRMLSVKMRSERFDNNFEIFTDILQQGSNLAILGLGANMVLQGELTPGALIAFAGILGLVMEPAEALANFYDEYLELGVALNRLNDVLSSPREPVNSDLPCPLLKGAIHLEKVSFRYSAEGRTILSDISLNIEPGQKVAFVGRSGSGKTTLVSMINRLLEPSSGTVTIDGVDISRVDLVSLRQQIGVVEQSPQLFAGTIRENIAKANPSLPLEAVASAATLAGVNEFVDRFPMRYDTRVGEGGRALSGGQTQRMVIARALAGNPRILVLDEATSALDTESEQLIQRNLDRIMRDRTTLVIAHRLSTVRNADLIVVLDAGKIVEKGTHDELMDAKGLYYYLATRTR
ncbi:MAG: peptidase domain-containing ABC transporter [Sulfuritalea sp.]|nr:peptidase domain-containing ABC transporter [Sulfuritalea sp.]